ncbi:transposase [bacterium]|nr:transposase [bacterium]MDB4577096.1 transposase [bacterium]
MNCCWRTDLQDFRGLSHFERSGFLICLEWFENFRLRHSLPAGREAAKSFWIDQVKREGIERETWQLEQWTEAIRWYLDWLEACELAGNDHRSLIERVRAAVASTGARRGLALRTIQCYSGWVGRFAIFAKSAKAMMKVETGTAFLQSEHSDLRPWEPRSIENERITELSRYSESIVREVAKLKTKCESAREPAIQRSLKRRIKIGEKEIKDIRDRITKIIRSKNDLKEDYDLLSSIPGMGPITCQIMIAEFPEIALFKSARELAAWAGLTPRHFVSGTSGRTTTPITKIGSAHLRRALFMPAMNARVFNPLLKEFGDRLQENGKKRKQIIIAIMRKLIHQAYGILKSREPYNPEKRGFINPVKA